MPLHDYECAECGKFFSDVYQKYEEEPLTKCEECGKESLQKIFAAPTFFVTQEAQTLGQLADRNAKKMGQREVQERDLKRKEQTKSAMSEAKKELYSGINKMSDTQKRKYIDGK
jgi:putative FmdB family regulatory protein|tara:strand:- start:250 stop:591 length:342 start_codon:yes stop_codon:yes gene_type:complete